MNLPDRTFENALEETSQPDDVFFHLEQEIRFLETELESYAQPSKENKNRPFPHKQIEALIQLKQIPTLFRASYNELLAHLPIAISLRSRSVDLSVTMTSAVDIPSTHYARFRCAFKDPARPSSQCATWTFVPYVTDSFLRGLARILSAAADTNQEGQDLEQELAAGYMQMFCSTHDENSKHEQADALAAASRSIVERWRGSELLWRNVGMMSTRTSSRTGRTESMLS